MDFGSTEPVGIGHVALADTNETIVNHLLLSVVADYCSRKSTHPDNCEVEIEHNDRLRFVNEQTVRVTIHNLEDEDTTQADIRFSHVSGEVTIDYID